MSNDIVMEMNGMVELCNLCNREGHRLSWGYADFYQVPDTPQVREIIRTAFNRFEEVTKEGDTNTRTMKAHIEHRGSHAYAECRWERGMGHFLLILTNCFQACDIKARFN